ncbi:MAG TPA: tetratricopeptide repeat protein, partial [Thermoanaerobaculia bacterium]|nr:tetratricopeptide repeat protein [Thermoanaerobaculia bacterium]
SDSFEVQSGFENAYQLAEGARAHVQQVYPYRRLRSGSQGATVIHEDYKKYAELQRRVDNGERLGETELADLDNLTRTSPGLIGAYVLATGVARILGHTDRALEYSERAEKLAPYDPRPLFARFQAELEGHQLDQAPKTLERLEKLAPIDARVKIASADLWEARRNLKEALSLREKAVQRRPTWRNILKLATLEFRLGKSDSASKRLGDLLTAQPDNQYVWDEVADVEVQYGDLHRAATLYEKMIRIQPASWYLLRNLASTYYLLGNYAAAAAADRRALALKPDDPWLRFHLAKTREVQGDLTGVKQVYSSFEKELAAAPHPLDMWHSLLEVQCLARLGKQVEATALADEIFRQRPEEAQILNQAAQLYAILRMPNRVYFYMEMALAKGLRREWFTIPEFRSLDKEDPKFRLLLDQYTAPKVAS